MLVFNELNKYEANEQTIVSREGTALNERSKLPTKKIRRNKLTKTNKQLLKSLGFKLKQTQQ